MEPVWVTIEVYTFTIFSTAYGDGVYPVEDEGELVGEAGVDAGCLCLIPLKLTNKAQRSMGVEVNISHNFRAKFPERGVGEFDSILVNTTGEDEYEEDDWE